MSDAPDLRPPIPPPTLADAYVVASSMTFLTDDTVCGKCNERFEAGQQVIDISSYADAHGMGQPGTTQRMTETLHLSCAIADNEVAVAPLLAAMNGGAVTIVLDREAVLPLVGLIQLALQHPNLATVAPNADTIGRDFVGQVYGCVTDDERTLIDAGWAR